jgi:predicted Zn-dependent protease with MMP-like domain
MKREYNFTQTGKIVTMFLTRLLRDKEVDLNKTMTDAYLFEIGYEMGLSEDNIIKIISELKTMGIVD